MIVGRVMLAAVEAASTVDLIELAELVGSLDTPILALLFAFALWRGWLHLPREIHHRDRMLAKTEEQVNVWKGLFLQAVDVADRAVDDEDV